jgi:hypothetical protein
VFRHDIDEKVHDGAYAGGTHQIAMRHQPEVHGPDLVGGEQLYQLGIPIRAQARQNGKAKSGAAGGVLYLSGVGGEGVARAAAIVLEPIAAAE